MSLTFLFLLQLFMRIIIFLLKLSLQFIIFRRMIDRNKTIQNYCLQDLKYYNPDQSQIWTAKHKILKKNFTLKRIKFRGNHSEQTKQGQISIKKQQWDYSNIVRESKKCSNSANILKRLISQICPKCHKMIKTSNNVYVVYDQFPQFTLKQHIVKNPPNRQQKLSLMLQIAKALNYLHVRSIILVYLSSSNVFIKDKNTVFFSDWTLARTVEAQDKIDPMFLGGGYESLSKQLIEGGKYSYWSDIYCLGTIFQKIFRSGLLEEPSQIDKRIEQLISKMHQEQGHQRPSLEEIIRFIQNLGGSSQSQKKNTQNKQVKITSLKSISNFKIKHSISTPESEQTKNNISALSPQKKYNYLQNPKTPKEQSLSTSFSKSAKTTKSQAQQQDLHSIFSTRKIESKRSFQIPNNSINNSRKKKQEQKVTTQQSIKLVLKKRNLAFFFVQLSEFVIRIWICPELGYVLLKYSLLTLKTAIKELQKVQTISLIKKEQLFQILTDQKMKITSNLLLLRKKVLNAFADNLLQREFEIDNQISDRYLKEKIIEFCKQMVIYCQNNKSEKVSSSHKLIDQLFKTYMILKKIEQGGYQKFWDKIYNSQCVFLHSQAYLKEQKGLGHRYLKSRIAEILRGK